MDKLLDWATKHLLCGSTSTGADAAAAKSTEAAPSAPSGPITTLVFDIDDTLYDVGTGFSAHRNGDAVFSFMIEKLGFEDAAAAKVVRDEYFHRHASISDLRAIR